MEILGPLGKGFDLQPGWQHMIIVAGVWGWPPWRRWPKRRIGWASA
ncbi:hypothetical protein NWF32_22935 [Pseudomonas qingdaonensis]|nr:hypothetical protein [Pseudomonas qingdaonensis]